MNGHTVSSVSRPSEVVLKLQKKTGNQEMKSLGKTHFGDSPLSNSVLPHPPSYPRQVITWEV